MSTHPNSHKVKIKTFLQYGEARIFEANGGTREPGLNLGSYLERGKKAIPRGGFTKQELELLFDSILGTHPSDTTFWGKVDDYFKELTISPTLSGIELEIGLTERNDAGLIYKEGKDTKTQNPIDAEDYIKYRYFSKHPKVAMTLAEAQSNPMKRAYIEDASVIAKETAKEMTTKNEALKQFFVIADDAKKVDMYLTLMGIELRSLPKEQRKFVLNSEIEKNPTKFIEHVNDKFAEGKYEVIEMTNYGLLKTVGMRYLNAEGNSVIGNDLHQAVLYMQDPANSEVLTAMRMGLTDAKKAVAVK